MVKRYLHILIFCFLLLNVSAQSELNYNAQITGVASSGNYSPFWLSANRNGISSLDNNWGYLRLGVDGATALKGDWSLNYGADVVGGKNLSSDIFVHQAYADVSWRWLRLSIGKKQRTGELKNSALSTGALVESGNAAPVPQVRIEVPEYRDFFGTNGWFTLRGHIAYGCFTDGKWQRDWAADGTRYAENVLYHSKSLFWKVGNESRFPLTYEGGVQFASQFGGKVYNMLNRTGDDVEMPTRPKDFWDIFIFSSGDENYTLNDQLNVAGNHLGSYHLSLKWTEENWSLRGYYEHMFEDHSGMFWEYGLWKDCLVGAELQLKNFRWLDNVVFEYFNSHDQAGPIYHDTTDKIPDQISAVDRYYNHGVYPCWQQYGYIIGSPLITSCIYNSDNIFEIYNNRVEAFHLGFSGHPFAEFGYRALLTKSHNWGSYEIPFTAIKGNVSALFELSYEPRWAEGFETSLSFAFDNGELYGNNRGVVLGIKKSGKFF